MSLLPPVPNRGADILTWCRRLLRAIKTMKPRTSATVRVIECGDGGYMMETYNRDLWRPVRWNILQSDTNAVEVSVGVWTRNGNRVTLTLDSGETYKTVTGISLSSSTYYIILTLSCDLATPFNPALKPDTLEVTADTDLPTETPDNITMIIGEVTTDGSGAINGVVTYRRNDIDDLGVVPDANTTLTDDTPRGRSIERIPAGDPDPQYHEGEMQVYGHLAGAEFGDVPDVTYDYVWMRDAQRIDGTGPDMILVNASHFASWVGDAIVTYIDAQGKYWIQGDTGDATCYGESIGNDSKAIVIDLDNKQLEVGAAVPVLAWGTQQLYDNSGVETANWNSKELISVGSTTLNWGTQKLLNGTWDCDGDFLPETTETYDLGSTSKVWSEGYFNSLILEDANSASKGSISWNVGAPSSLVLLSELDLTLSANGGGYKIIIDTATVLPANDGTTNIGTSSKQFQDLYLSNSVVVNGTTLTLQTIEANVGGVTKDVQVLCNIA